MYVARVKLVVAALTQSNRFVQVLFQRVSVANAMLVPNAILAVKQMSVLHALIVRRQIFVQNVLRLVDVTAAKHAQHVLDVIHAVTVPHVRHQ